jgi:CPA1 family monovalent cation:H+ antiporter
MSHFITVADPNPGFKGPIIFGWAGMRGVVSLAAALSVPLLINGNQPFPHRNLILFITFIVILVTLVVQGLTLPWVIRKVNLEENNNHIPEQKQEVIIQKKMAIHSLQYLEDKYGQDWPANEHLDNLRARLQIDMKILSGELVNTDTTNENSLVDFNRIYLEILDHQRRLLTVMNRRSEFDEELIRKYLSLIDVDEFKLREKQLQKSQTA